MLMCGSSPIGTTRSRRKRKQFKASNEKNLALHEKEQEAEKARAAARWALSANATNLLLSELPDRRAKGLDLLQKIADPEKAVPLDQDPALTPAELRDQAVEFLVLRDVQPRPDFSTGPTRGIEFGPGGTVLAALSDDGQEVSLWNVESRQRFETIALGDGPRQPSSSAAAREPPQWQEQPEGRETWLAIGTCPFGITLQPGRQPAPAAARPPRGGIASGRSPCACRPYPGCGPACDEGGLRLFDVRTGSPLA